jgi:hypothetical protein
MNAVVSMRSTYTGKVLTEYCCGCVSLKDNETKVKLHRDSGVCRVNCDGASDRVEATGVAAVFECLIVLDVCDI